MNGKSAGKKNYSIEKKKIHFCFIFIEIFSNKLFIIKNKKNRMKNKPWKIFIICSIFIEIFSVWDQLWLSLWDLPFLSIFVSKILCEADGAISAISSAAVSRCSTKGLAIGDSTRGSRGSKGVIKCARTHCLGSSTSRTDSGLPDLFLSAMGACLNSINKTNQSSSFFTTGKSFYFSSLNL